MLPVQARVELRMMAMKWYSAYPKAPALLEPHHQIVYSQIQDTGRRGSYPFELVYSTAPTDWATEWTWEPWQWRGTPHSPKLQYYLNLTISLFSVISKTLVLPFSKEAVSVFYTASWLGNLVWVWVCGREREREEERERENERERGGG